MMNEEWAAQHPAWQFFIHHSSLFTYRAPLTLVQFTAETFLYQQMQAVFQGIQTDCVDYFVYEGKHQQ